MAVKLSLIVPCYNEEATLREIVEKVLALRSETLELEVVIVDDCSRDRSCEIASELAAQYPGVVLAKHEVNQGKGAALRTGFLKATGDFVGVQDADMEYDPKDYLMMPKRDGKVSLPMKAKYCFLLLTSLFVFHLYKISNCLITTLMLWMMLLSI